MSLSYVVDGETELDSELFNPWVDHMNGLQSGAAPIALAGIASLPVCAAGTLGQLRRVEHGTGVGDAIYVCRRKADDSYVWSALTLIDE